MPFESLVRPFESPGAHGRITIPSTPGATTERATLTWGAQVEGRVTPKRSGINVECCSNKENETKRKTQTERIIQDGEPENWIDVARATKMSLKNKHKNECIADWDQMSGVAFGVHEALAEFEADMSFSEANDPEETCAHEITYKANTRAAG